MQRRTTLHPLTSLLTLAIVFALFAGGWRLTTPASADLNPAGTEQVVRDFYEAVNQTIRTGNPTAFDEIVSAEVVTHGNLATLASDRSGLVRYLENLHETFPDLELTATDIVITEDRAIADVSLAGAVEAKSLGSTLRGGTPWGETDAFRVRNQRIAEIWSGAQDVVLLESGARAPFTVVDPPERTVTLDRLTIPTGGSYVATSADEQRWLFVESSTITAASLRHERSKTMELGSAGEALNLVARPTEQRNPAELETGELVSLPIWSQTEVRNIGAAPAMVLVLAAGLPGPIVGMQSDPAGHSVNAQSEAVEGWPGWLDGAPRISESGAMLASLMGTAKATMPGEHSVIATGQMTLAPGTAISTQIAGPQLVVVEAGMLNLVSEGEPAWIYHDRGSDLQAGALGPGAGALLREDAVVHLRNPGDEPTVATIIAILPAEALTNGAV